MLLYYRCGKEGRERVRNQEKGYGNMKREEIIKKINADETMSAIFNDAVFAYAQYMEDGECLEGWNGINIGLESALRRMLGFDIADVASDWELHEAVKMQCQFQYYF